MSRCPAIAPDRISWRETPARPAPSQEGKTMLTGLAPALNIDIAIVFTALAWGIGLTVADRKVYVFASLAIGCFVVLLGYSIADLGAPGWAVMAGPMALDFFLLWYVLRTPRKMAVAYVVTWPIYIGLHVILSSLLHYDSLIPVWRLHS
jgi:hypothetical protein